MSLGEVDPDAARDRARDIVDGFRPKDPPRPFRGALDWIGDRFEQLGRLLRSPFRWLFETAGDGLGWLIVGAAFAAVVAMIASSVRHGTLRRVMHRTSAAARSARTRTSPEDLEAAAVEAAARGEFDVAVRLRFEAGLQRLDRDARAIVYTSSIATSEVRQLIEQPTFDQLADRFERVAYRQDPAAASDDVDARRDWPHVVESAKR